MAGRLNPAVQEKRQALLTDKDKVLARYRDGESLNSLSKAYGVGNTWLTAQFDEWGEPRRDRSQAGVARGSVGATSLKG